MEHLFRPLIFLRANGLFEDERRYDSLRALEESFKPWEFGLFVRGLGKVLLGGAEAPAEAGEHCSLSHFHQS